MKFMVAVLISLSLNGGAFGNGPPRLRGAISGNGSAVTLESEVRYDPGTQEYVYAYRIKNDDHRPGTFGWENLDILINGEGVDKPWPVIFELEPGETYVFTTRHRSPPVEHTGMAYVYHRSPSLQRHVLGETKTTVSSDHKAKAQLWFRAAFGQNSYLPRSLVPVPMAQP